MAREPAAVYQFEHRPQYRLAKEMTVVRCDDGAIYQFERPLDDTTWRLAKAFQPDGERTHTGSRKILPDAVDETVQSLIGGWSK